RIPPEAAADKGDPSKLFGQDMLSPSPEQFPGLALGPSDPRQLLLDEVVQAGLRRFQFAQRYIVLVVEIAEAIAGAGPAGIFGERALGLILFELSDQRDDLRRELLVGDRKLRVGADHQTGGIVGRQ